MIFLCDQSYASHGRDFLLGATILNPNARAGAKARAGAGAKVGAKARAKVGVEILKLVKTHQNRFFI